jgi:hypothetical protein
MATVPCRHGAAKWMNHESRRAWRTALNFMICESMCAVETRKMFLELFVKAVRLLSPSGTIICGFKREVRTTFSPAAPRGIDSRQ